MQVSEAIRTRRSIRQFDPDYVVDDRSLRTILEAARLSPSGTNTQPWRFIVVDRKDEAFSKLMAATLGQKCFSSASCLIVCAADLTAKRHAKDRLGELVGDGVFTVKEAEDFVTKQGIGSDPSRDAVTARRDVAIAVYGMMLQARELDIDTCWIAVKKPKDGQRHIVRDACGIPYDKYIPELPDDEDNRRFLVVSMLALGKCAVDQPKQRPRFAFERIVTLNGKWNPTWSEF